MKTSEPSAVIEAAQAGPGPAGVSVLAIVPGVDGGVAMSVAGVFDCRRMPATEDELATLLRRLRPPAGRPGKRPVCLLAEQDPVLIPDADRLGALRGMLLALEFDVVPVRPEAWLARLPSVPPAGVGLNLLQLKVRLQLAAGWFFPNLDITPGTAVALAILLWGMQREHTRPGVARPGN